MSSQMQNNHSDGESARANAFGSSSVRKTKKKKKIGFFSFRSKKTKTINNNVISQQIDTLSISSGISVTEDRTDSSLESTDRHLTDTSVRRSSLDSVKDQRSADSPIGYDVQKTELAKGLNGHADAALEDFMAEVGEDGNIVSLAVAEEVTDAVPTAIAEEHSRQANDLRQRSEKWVGEDGTLELQPAKTEIDSQSAETGHNNNKTSESGVQSVRPNSICLKSASRTNSPFKLQSSLTRRQKILADQLGSSTDCSSYPASPVKSRLKSKRIKMPRDVSATHRLVVRLLSGQNLAARDSNGLSDPYVKFKLGSKTVYRSKTCKATLNPIWGEEFTFSVAMKDEISVRVFDKDIGRRDDFMGSSSFDVHSLIEDEESELELHLVDDDADKGEELGKIHLAVTLSPIKEDAPDGNDVHITPEDNGDTISLASVKISSLSRSDSNASDISRRTTMSEKYKKSKAPIAIATVQLVSGKGLPAKDSNGLSDPYVKLQLGKQRQKSKVCPKTLDPVWKEEFVFQLTNKDSLDREKTLLEMTVLDKDSYRKDDLIGRCELDFGSLEYDRTYSYDLSLKDAPGSILVLVTLHSCFPSDSISMDNRFVQVKDKYSLASTFSDISNIGCAEVKISRANGCRAADIGGKSDPFCVVKLCNARAQTHTCYKTLDPVWNKTVTFPIKDVHDVLVFTVYDEDKDGNDFLGKLAIPLLRVSNGVERTYALKDQKLLGRVKGTITVQITYIFNPVRAAIRTFSPREEIHMKPDSRFKRQLLTRNFSRVWASVQAVLRLLEFVNSCFTWQNPMRSATAFVVYLLVVWNIELYMLPILLLLLLAKSYFDVFVQKTKVDRRLSVNPEESFQVDDDDDDVEDTNNKVSFLQRLKAIEGVLLKVQNILDWIASLLERIHNTFTWSVPFLSALAVVVLSVVTIILYFIPLRTIALLWGINKFTKRLRKPNYIPNNELLDFLSRIPSEVELDEFQELPTLQASLKGPKKKK